MPHARSRCVDVSIARMTSVFAAPEPREAADRLMLLALADNANDQGVCWPSVPTLASKCAVDKRNVMKTLARLEDDGHVRVERRSGRVNVYHLSASAAPSKGRTRDVRVTGDAGVTGDVQRTRDVGDRGTRDVGVTPPVTYTSPEPSENHQENPHHNNTRERESSAPSDVVVVGRMGNGNAMSDAADTEAVDTPAAVGGGEPRHVDALVKRGVTAGVAHRLAATFGERIDAALAAFDRNGEYGPGWLVRAVESGWAAERPTAADTPPQGAYGTGPEPRRMQGQALLWLEEHGYPASALLDFFELAGTWEMDPDLPPVAMYRRVVG